MILGPTLPKEFRDLTKRLFPIDTQGVISTLTLFGYMLFTFLVGVKLNLSMVKTTGKKKAFAEGSLALMVPLIVGNMTAQVLLKEFIRDKDDRTTASLVFVAGLQSLSPSVVVTMLLKELKILNSELGRLALASSLSSEVLGVTVAFITNTLRSYMETSSLSSALQCIALIICFVLVVHYHHSSCNAMDRQADTRRKACQGRIHLLRPSDHFTRWCIYSLDWRISYIGSFYHRICCTGWTATGVCIGW